MARKKSRVPKLVHFSDYLPPGSDNEQTYRARLFLIEVTRRCVPEFLQELSTRVFPLYEELADSGYGLDRIVWRSSAYKLLGLKQALAEWAARFNAQDVEWLMVGALSTMREWRTDRASRERLKWSSLAVSSIQVAANNKEEFRYRPRDLTELWKDYFRGACEALMEYKARTDEFARAHGWKPARRQHSPVNLEWFALYQFAGKSAKEIAAEYSLAVPEGIDESTVLKGIQATAKLVAWDNLRQPDSRRKTR